MPIPPRSTGARVLLPLLALTLTACAAPSTPPLSPRLPPPDPRLMAPPPEPVAQGCPCRSDASDSPLTRLVNLDALIDGLESGQLAGAALSVLKAPQD